MDTPDIFIVIIAGLAGGVIAGMVGGGSIVTFPAMLYIGLPPVMATASNIVALTLSNVAGVFADLKRLPPLDRAFGVTVACACVGSAAGAALLLVTPEKYFTPAIPLLIGLGTTVFAFSDRIKRYMARGEPDPVGHSAVQYVLIAATAVYGSFFGASFTVLLIAVLSLSSSDQRSINVTKNLLASLIGMVAVIIFIIQTASDAHGVIAVLPTALLTAAAAAGGYLGGWLARRIPANWLRWIVIAIGVYLTIYYACKYWG